MIDEALVARMEALVRQIADYYDNGKSGDQEVVKNAFSWMRDAHEVVALLPKPVDLDLIEARALASEKYDAAGWEGSKDIAEKIRAGLRDTMTEVDLALAAIKRGRELAARDAA